MKIRSKALYGYLRQARVLNGAPEAIELAKKRYRALYKKRWKQQKRPQKEMRIMFTLKQFEAIKYHAGLSGLRPTPYARKAIIASVETNYKPLSEERLSRSLQLLSMAAISLSRQFPAPQAAIAMIDEAETILISLVKNQINGR